MMMIMMIAPDSLARQKKGAHGEEEEESGDRRMGGQTGTPTPGADAPTGPSRSEVLDVRNSRRHGR